MALQRTAGNQAVLALMRRERIGQAPAQTLQRNGDGDSDAQQRANDPNFLLCLALCELGIPPALWRTIITQVLSAISEEYRGRYGELRGSQEFQRFSTEFSVWSDFNKAKLVIGFLGESRVGLLTIERPAAQALRRRLLERLAELGVREAAIETASQVLRRVALVIEGVWLAGCAAYCGGTAYANAILSFSQAAIGAVASFTEIAQGLGNAIARGITHPIVVARVMMDATNWNLSALPARSRQHMGAISLAFRLAFTPDSFITSVSRPLSSFNIGGILSELAADINGALAARGGFLAAIQFTPEFLGGLTPLSLVHILHDYGLLQFVQDPDALATAQEEQPAEAAAQ
jgi:hypothetical protein